MNVLAINGSPHMEAGNTAMILGPFLEGMKEAGAEVELLYTKKLNIAPCSGDMSCWFERPGECAVKDDMQNVLPKIRKADILVFATPIYYAGMTGPLKNLIDRQLPMYMQRGNESEHRTMAVLVSTCGAWEMDMFEPLVAQMRAIYMRPDGRSDFVGALLRPHAEVMKELIKAGETGQLDGVFRAAHDAGAQLVREGRMSDEALKSVSKSLISQEVYNKAAEEMFRQAEEGGSK